MLNFFLSYHMSLFSYYTFLFNPPARIHTSRALYPLAIFPAFFLYSTIFCAVSVPDSWAWGGGIINKIFSDSDIDVLLAELHWIFLHLQSHIRISQEIFVNFVEEVFSGIAEVKASGGQWKCLYQQIKSPDNLGKNEIKRIILERGQRHSNWKYIL